MPANPDLVPVVAVPVDLAVDQVVVQVVHPAVAQEAHPVLAQVAHPVAAVASADLRTVAPAAVLVVAVLVAVAERRVRLVALAVRYVEDARANARSVRNSIRCRRRRLAACGSVRATAKWCGWRAALP